MFAETCFRMAVPSTLLQQPLTSTAAPTPAMRSSISRYVTHTHLQTFHTTKMLAVALPSWSNRSRHLCDAAGRRVLVLRALVESATCSLSKILPHIQRLNVDDITLIKIACLLIASASHCPPGLHSFPYIHTCVCACALHWLCVCC